MQEPEQVQQRIRRGEVAGVGIGRVLVPWSTVALAVVMVMGLGGMLLTGGSDGDDPGLQIDAAASGDAGEEIPAGTPTDDSSTTTTSADESAQVAPESSTTSTTSTTMAATTTTLAATTTTTRLQPGSAEVLVFSGEQGEGWCPESEPEWGFFGCPSQGLRPEFTFNLDTRRYPATARYTLDLAVAVTHDFSYCMRLFDLDRNTALAGSEQCWTTPAVAPPAPYQAYPPDTSFSSQVGSISFPAGAGRYVLQTKLRIASTGQPCTSHYFCSAQLKRAKVIVDWG